MVPVPASAVPALVNPAQNIPPIPDFLTSTNNPCVVSSSWPAADNSESCDGYIVQAIDNARSELGERPLVLPTNWYHDTTAEQLYTIISLERTALGYPAYRGMNSQLTSAARRAAEASSPASPIHGIDPSPVEPPRYPLANNASGQLFGGGWSAGWNPLVADYMWMYDDGWSGTSTSNIACTSATAPGCWAHRDEILGHEPSTDFAQGPGLACTTCEVGAWDSPFTNTSSFVVLIEAYHGRHPKMFFTYAKDVLPYLITPETPTTTTTTTQQPAPTSSTAPTT